MNAKPIEIRIPAEIAALPLPIAEKVVLTHIHHFPGCSNGRLAELIGGTVRGVESMLRRLRQHGYIEETRKGRARRHHLTFRVEHHTICGDLRSAPRRKFFTFEDESVTLNTEAGGQASSSNGR